VKLELKIGLLAATLLLPVLTACDEKSGRTDVQVKADALLTDLNQLKLDVDQSATSLSGYLIGVQSTSSCRTAEETAAFKTGFDRIGVDLAGSIADATTIAETGAPVEPHSSAAEELEQIGAKAASVKTTLVNAASMKALLQESIERRDEFKNRADKAWGDAVVVSTTVTPWFNRQRSAGGTAAAEAMARNAELQNDLKELGSYHDAVERELSDLLAGGTLNCTNFAVSIVSLEATSKRIQAKSAELLARWRGPEAPGIAPPTQP
jgi:hypothetical protein